MHKSYCTCPRCHRGKRIKTGVIAGLVGAVAIAVVLSWSMILTTFNQTLGSVSTPSSRLVVPTERNGESVNVKTKSESTDTPTATTNPDGSQSETSQPEPTPKVSDNTKDTARLNPDNIARKIHDHVNEHRRDNNMPSMEYDEELQAVALGHSRDMAENNFFDHDNLEGADPSQRAVDAGYTCYKELPGGFYRIGIGENIAQNYNYESITYISGFPIYDWVTEDELAYSIFDQWRTSPGHNENMLEPSYDREGLGIFIDTDGEVYATENLC